MSTVTKNGIEQLKVHTAPYGNAWNNKYTFETNSSGVFVDSDKKTAVIQTDVVRLGLLPAGLEIHNSLSIVSDAFTALTTCKLGWQYADGVDVTATPQDDDYFSASVATNAVGRYLANNTAVRPVKLPKEAYLIITVEGANHAAVGVMDVIISGDYKGV
jgi:hypothetical protein